MSADDELRVWVLVPDELGPLLTANQEGVFEVWVRLLEGVEGVSADIACWTWLSMSWSLVTLEGQSGTNWGKLSWLPVTPVLQDT